MKTFTTYVELTAVEVQALKVMACKMVTNTKGTEAQVADKLLSGIMETQGRVAYHEKELLTKDVCIGYKNPNYDGMVTCERMIERGTGEVRCSYCQDKEDKRLQAESDKEDERLKAEEEAAIERDYAMTMEEFAQINADLRAADEYIHEEVV